MVCPDDGNIKGLQKRGGFLSLISPILPNQSDLP